MKIIQISGNVIELGDGAFIHQSIDEDEEISLLDDEFILQCDVVGLLAPLKVNEVVCIYHNDYTHFYEVLELYDYKAKIKNI